jgi:hypothetical protein
MHLKDAIFHFRDKTTSEELENERLIFSLKKQLHNQTEILK